MRNQSIGKTKGLVILRRRHAKLRRRKEICVGRQGQQATEMLSRLLRLRVGLEHEAC